MSYSIFFLLLTIQFINKSNGFYFWKDFYGKIPRDAFPAGKDVNNEDIYIGQGFARNEHDFGIFPVTISIGKGVFAPFWGPKKADNFTQILCTDDAGGFEWLPSNYTHFHLMQTDNELIRGGIEEDKWLNIGRVQYQGGTVFGKVLSGNIGAAIMWFVYNGEELDVFTYEVLTYNNVEGRIQERIAET